MPLVNIQQVNENIHLAVWKITEDLADLKNQILLSAEDSAIYQEIKHKGKALEFLAGRMLCREAFLRLEREYFPIHRNVFGKPEMPNSPFHLSLSHTDQFVVLIIGNAIEVGIDIEKPQEKMRTIAPRILNTNELRDCSEDLIRFSKMWSAKEVLYKLYMKREIDFRDNLFLKPLDITWKAMEGEIKKGDYKKISKLEFINLQEYFICFNTN